MNDLSNSVLAPKPIGHTAPKVRGVRVKKRVQEQMKKGKAVTKKRDK